jgi:hypothetical protein
MTTATLRPNGTIAPPDSVTGAATAHAATNDDSDSSYFTASSIEVELALGTVTLPAGAQTKQLRLRWRANDPSIASAAECRVRTPTVVFQADGRSLGAAIESFASAYVPVTLSQSTVNDLRLTWVGTAGGDYRVYEGYVDLIYVEQPVVAVDAVSPDPYTASSFVPISWVNTLDSDGGGQTFYYIKVYDATTHGAFGSVDPNATTPFWESGKVASSATEATTGALPNDGYRVYVRTYQTVNGAQHWSAWDSDDFTVTVDDAEIDTVTMVADNATASIEVTVERDTATEAWEFVEVQRSIDGGTTWSYVRGAAYVDATGDADTFVIDDYEVPNGQTVEYRARATRIVTELPITSPWTQSASSTSWSSDDVWLKNPIDPSLNMTVCLRSAPSGNRQARRGVFPVIGLANPVVVFDVMGGVQTGFEVRAATIAQTADLEALASSGILLLQAPPTMPDGSRYLHPGGVRRSAYEPSHIRPKQWIALSDAIEVDAPADSTAGV